MLWYVNTCEKGMGDVKMICFLKENRSFYIIEHLAKRVEREIEFIWFNCLELRVKLGVIRMVNEENWKKFPFPFKSLGLTKIIF